MPYDTVEEKASSYIGLFLAASLVLFTLLHAFRAPEPVRQHCHRPAGIPYYVAAE